MVNSLLALASGSCVILAAILTAWRQLRVEVVHSKKLEARANKLLSAAGYRGTPSVTVNRKVGGQWRTNSYAPSQRDDPLDPEDHNRRIFALMDEVSKDFPSYYWNDRRLTLLILALSLGAAVLAIGATFAS